MAQKHIDSLRLFDLVIETKSVPVMVPEESHPGWSPKGPNKKPEQDPLPIHPVNPAFDDFLSHALIHFPSSKGAPAAVLEEYSRIMSLQTTHGNEIYELLKRDPESIPEMIWGPLLCRSLMMTHAIPVNHRVVKSFRQFHEEHVATLLSEQIRTWR